MREPYGEGVAIHADPESCAVVRKDGGEALAGARAGRVLSREIQDTSGCRRFWLKRKAKSNASLTRDAIGACAVQDPEHVRKHPAREPGDPASA